MIGKHKKKTVNLVLVFALIFSLFTPFGTNVSKAAEMISVAEAIANNSGIATVEGYIVGITKSGGGGKASYSHSAPFTMDTNIAIADSPNETNPSKILPVQLPSGSIRTELNLKEHPENLGKKIQITGTLGAYFSVPGLLNSKGYSFITETNPTKVQAVSATPKEGMVPQGTKVELTTSTEGATIYFTADGSEPNTNSAKYSAPIEITVDTTIKAMAVKEGLTNSDVSQFSYSIALENLRIHDIQGEGHYSPHNGKNVSNVEGIVTYVNGSEFYIQDLQPDANEKTSEGLLVYKKSHGVQVGDVVKVSGQVKEWVLEGYAEKLQTDLPVTEINATDIQKMASNQDLPAAIIIGEDRIPPAEIIDNDKLAEFDPEEDGIDFFESLEGMLVQVDNPKVVALQKYGELTVIPGTMETNTTDGGLRITENDYNPERIMIDINDESYVAKMGDRFEGSIKGVVSYGFSNYKVLSKKADLPTLIEGSNTRETTSITPEADKLTLASYNVENFSTKTDDAKVTKLAEAIVSNMKTPDIIGLTEVQDNDGATDSGTIDASESANIINRKN